MAVARKLKAAPAPQSPGQEAPPEKTPAALEIEAWYQRFTSREDVREILTRLAK